MGLWLRVHGSWFMVSGSWFRVTEYFVNTCIYITFLYMAFVQWFSFAIHNCENCLGNVFFEIVFFY